MSYRIRKSFTFEAAHQLETANTAACHECIHGHSYTVEMVVEATSLDGDLMVVDFSRLADFKADIMGLFDHGLILHENKRQWIWPLIEAKVLKYNKVSFLPSNPTAEVIARLIYYRLKEYLQVKVGEVAVQVRGIRVVRVRIHETSTGWAEYQEGK